MPPSSSGAFPAPCPPTLASLWHRLLPLLLAALSVLALCGPLPARAQAEQECPAEAALGPGHDIRGQALLRDPSRRLTLGDVASAARAAEFEPLPGQLSAGYTRDILWLRFCLPPSGDTLPRWLRVAPPMLDDLALYLPQAGGGYELRRAGDRYPFAAREWQYRLFAIAIPPNTDVRRPFYLRLDTTSALNMRLDLWHGAEFQDLVVRDTMFYGLLGGTILLLIVFSLISWRWLGDRLYLFYAGNVLAGGIFLLMNAGFGSQFAYPELGGANDLAIAWLTGPILAVHVLFFTYLFAVRQHLPRLYPLMLALAGTYAALAPLSLFTDWRTIGLILQLLAFPVTLLWMLLIVTLGLKDPKRRIYIVAFLPWLTGLFGNALFRMGGISDNFWISYSGEITALIHLIILPILIIHRARQAELEKDRALARELAEAHRVERELEARVRERTSALRQEIETRSRIQARLQDALTTEQATLANQRELVAMLSHEFRTPLTLIDTVAQRLDMMLERIHPELVPRILKIRSAVTRLLGLLENCLANERLNDTGTELRLETVDVCAHLTHAYRGEAAPAEARRIRLDLPEVAVRVRCDRHLFDVALSNLVGNALKYSPPDSPVTLRVRREPAGQVAIAVQDRGQGVRPADRERIFERFFRSDGLRPQGSGLGLHLARSLARRHGGDVILEAGAEAMGAEEAEGMSTGAGTTFILTLPEDGPPVATDVAVNQEPAAETTAS